MPTDPIVSLATKVTNMVEPWNEEWAKIAAPSLILSHIPLIAEKR